MPFLPPPDPGFEISVATRGMSKGLSQTDGMQVVGRGELAFGPFFVSALGKNITSPTADAELQFATGTRFKVDGTDVGVAATLKRLVGLDGQKNPTALELSANVSHPFGKLTPKVQLIYSPDDLGSTTYSLYAEGGVTWKLHPKIQLSANIGRRHRGNALDYTSANVGAAVTITSNFTGEVKLYDTNKSDMGDPFKRRLVASLKAKF
jgi:hypothetical protein